MHVIVWIVINILNLYIRSFAYVYCSCYIVRVLKFCWWYYKIYKLTSWFILYPAVKRQASLVVSQYILYSLSVVLRIVNPLGRPLFSMHVFVCDHFTVHPSKFAFVKKKHTIWPLSQKFSNSSISAITPLNISITTFFHRETEYITITYAIKSYFIYDFIVSAKL